MPRERSDRRVDFSLKETETLPPDRPQGSEMVTSSEVNQERHRTVKEVEEFDGMGDCYSHLWCGNNIRRSANTQWVPRMISPGVKYLCCTPEAMYWPTVVGHASSCYRLKTVL